MYNRLNRSFVIASAGLMFSLLAGCSSMGVDKLWPFDDKSGSGQIRLPANTAQYQCAGGKRFQVRTVDNGSTVWLIYPEREVSLTKASATRYTNGVAVLDINGSEATLSDGASIAYNGCKALASKP